MKRRKVSEEEPDVEEHDVDTETWIKFVNSDPNPTPGPTLGPRMRDGRPMALKQTSVSGPQSSESLDIGGSVLKKKLKKKRKGLQNITFEKILPSSAAPASGSRANLTVPAWFIKEHGDQLQESVVLRCAASKQKWTVHLGIYYSRNVAQVKFYVGWRDFACFNGLDEGDQLVFCLRQDSQFDVYIYREARGPDSAPSLSDTDTEPPLRKTKMVRAYRKKNKKANRSGPSLAELIKTERATDYTAKPISTFKPFEDAAPTLIQNSNNLSFFIKRIVSSNLRDAAGYASGSHFEIPRGFARKHNKHLENYVKLHGISEDSPVHIVACRSNAQVNKARLYLRTGWSRFVSDNNLRLGQALVFTLVAKSTFVVKEAPASRCS